MAVPILTENSLLVYDFARSRSKIPFEKIIRALDYTCARSLIAYSGETLQKEKSKILSHSVNTNHSMRQRRMGLESIPILLWALLFGDSFSLYQIIQQIT